MIRPLITLKDNNRNVLFETSKEIKEKNDNLSKIIDDLVETMYLEKGIGLSGVQVNFLFNIFVMDIPQNTLGPMVFINPKIIKFSQDFFIEEEGCLSIPHIRIRITRPRSILVRYFDENFNQQELLADGLKSICIQHEIDHLNGILILSRANQKDKKKIIQDLIENHYSLEDLKIGDSSYV